MGGRFVWSSTSDYIGRKPIYMIYLGGGIVLYIILATLGSTATWIFVLTAAIIISFYGGGFATVPAYLRDLFGTFQVGAIHGRLLTAWSAAGIAGPLIINGVLDAAGTPGRAGRRRLPAGAVHHGRPAGRRLRRQPAGQAGGRASGTSRRTGTSPRPPPRKRAPSDELSCLDRRTSSPPTPRSALIAFAWTLVGVPLAYGLYQTVKTASALFGG